MGGVLSAMIIAGTLLAQDTEPGKKDEAEKKIQVQAGEKAFLKFECFACHGHGGKGGVKNPNAMGGEVPALTKVAEGYILEELKEKILRGVPSVDKQDPNGCEPPLFMPAWKDVLSKEQVEAIAAYLMSLKPASGKDDKW